jgi:CHASE2 domain-containing sensor protein
MLNKNLALALGALTGLVSLVAMVRLVSGAFDGGLSVFAWVITLLAMVPWVVYAAARARHSRLTLGHALVVAGLAVVGLVVAWLFVLGPVVALVCSLAAFAVIWVRDWPERGPRGEDRFVRIEELTAEERD